MDEKSKKKSSHVNLSKTVKFSQIHVHALLLAVIKYLLNAILF